MQRLPGRFLDFIIHSARFAKAQNVRGCKRAAEVFILPPLFQSFRRSSTHCLRAIQGSSAVRQIPAAC